ncbi:MAG: glycosyltransferase family 9 protein [Bacteroidota bacterium]|nr:glycosyltransferase family 9 protein [Bacteroidota bacterium]
MNASVKNILLIRTDRIGDVVLSLPMLPVLKRHFPSAKITIMVRRYTKELVERHPCVDDVMLWEADGERSLMQNVALLKQRNFDIAILPYPRFNLALMIFLAGIPLRVGTGYRWYSFLLNKKIYEHRKDAKRHEVEYNLHLLKALGIEESTRPQFDFTVTAEAQHAVEKILRKDKIIDAKFAVVHVGSGGSARDWPLENFARLADVIKSKLNMNVVLTGGKNEEALVGMVVSKMKTHPMNYVGKFSLMELGALFQRASVFVSNSTGPLHIASVVGTPVVAFYPPIIQCSPARWGPYTEKKKIFTADNIKCELCKGGACRSNICMNQISVEQVFAGVKDLLHDKF